MNIRLAPLLLLPFLTLPACAMDAGEPISPPVATNAQCFGADGKSQTYAASEDAYVDLAGVWDRCASTLTDLPSDVAGVSFQGKIAQFMVRDVSGNLVPGAGSAYQRSVQLRLDPQGIVIVLADSDGSFATYSAQITATPHRLRIENTTTHAYLTLGARI